MSPRLFVAALVGALSLFACHREPSPHSTGPGEPGKEAAEPSAGAERSAKRAGTGHTANIDLVALSHDGTAALTRDQIGGVRLWPELDGTAEPIAIPTQGAINLSVEPRGDDGYTVAVVEPAGAARIYGVDPSGAVSTLGELPPFSPLFGAWVLPGGERVLALFRDHGVRLLDRDATVLARLDERRFRPTELRLSADGGTFVAVTRDGAKIELQRGTIGSANGKPTLQLVGKPRAITPATPMTASGSSLSADAARWAFVDRVVGSNWEIAIVELAKDAGETRVSVQIPAHLNPNIGFSSDHALLVSASDGSLSWLIDVRDGDMRPRDAAPQDFVNQGRAQAVAAGVHVSGHGTWLFVHDVVRRGHRFLGYRSFQAQSVAVSPSGELVAWAHMQGPLVIEPIAGDGTRVEIASGDNLGTFRTRFIDEDHVLAVDGAGGIRLHEWRTGRLVDHVGVNGGVRAVHFEPKHGLLLVERHNNDARVWSVSRKGFEGPWIIADTSFRCGLLTPDSKAADDAVVWTIDSTNRLRRYSMADLKADLTRSEIEQKGEVLANGKVAPLAIDRFGRQYGVRWSGSAMELFVDTGKHIKTTASPIGDINQIIPSHDGTRFIAVHQRGQSTSLSMHSVDTLEEQWSFSTGVSNNEIEWAPNGEIIAVAANTGAVLLDAATGEPVLRRCGIEFRSSGSPPSTAFNGVNLRSLCEP